MMDFIKAGAVDNDPGQLAFSLANGLERGVGYYSSMADDLDEVPSFISPAVKSALGIANVSGWGENNLPEMVDFYGPDSIR